MSVRAGIVVTGTEVLTGRVADRNGPWLADRLEELGVDLAHIVIVGDRRGDVLAALRFMAAEGLDLVLTSGGLGPTADDLTAEVVGEFQDREMVLDEALEERIAEILRPLAKRWPNLDMEAIRASNRKQAVIPRGATVLDPVGTAPGLVVGPGERAVVGVGTAPARASRMARRGGTRRARARGAPRWWSSRAPRGSCSRCGRPRCKRTRCARCSRVRRCTAVAHCVCSGSPSRRSPRPCGWPSARAWSLSAWRSRRA